ncbi:MAG: hypothetical protein Pg6A_15870 [Termitinemataceae bacterium]|nr:MAG: hypothetical protein Pg6A_15870 [Termitinemataceae bacterium]
MKCKPLNITMPFIEKHRVLLLHLALGVLFRYCVMLRGHNFDFESYVIVGDIVSQFGNVYARTSRYNYGPLFSCVMGLFYAVAKNLPHPIFFYRVFIVGLLTCADVGIALFIRKKCGRAAAVLFFLNPVSIIITGYHNQFDNIAVFIALAAIRFYNTENRFTKKDILFIALMSLSLITKHIVVFFFFWLLLKKELPLKKRCAFVVVPSFLFLLSFLPFFHGAGQDGIINNVFLYRSFNNMPLLQPLIWLVHQGGWLVNRSGGRFYFPLFIILVCAAGYIFRKKDAETSLLLYLVCLTAFSSAVANQYLAIPLVSLFVLTKYSRLAYVFFMSIYLAVEANGLHIQRLHALPFIGVYCDWAYSLACFILFLVILKYAAAETPGIRPEITGH